MAILTNPQERFWRTDERRGRGLYALISNDTTKPSEHDPLVATAESYDLAEMLVDVHNSVLKLYGRNFHYRLLETK